MEILLLDGFIQRFIEWIIHHGGFFFLLLVIFAETGLFVGFFFPGDSLLFASGIFMNELLEKVFNVADAGALPFGLYHIIIIIAVMVASVLGNIVGYWFGYKTGPLLYERKETWLFKRKHLLKAKSFYHKYGKGTIFLAKFLPIIRTFAPIVAGVVKMEKHIFVFYNIVGSVCWVSSMMLGGFFLQNWVEKKFDFSLKDHIEAITIGLILVTTLPVLYKLFFGKHEEYEPTKE
ncbi:MAG: DedA family protein [Bacteroidetes bacterium]|nr:MAG: DedA family protein [Bacteroidota bacterium]